MTFDTDRLNLSDLTHEDAHFVLRLLNEPAFIAMIGDRQVRTPEDACGWIDSGPAASYARHGFGLWRVSLKANGEPIGICGLLKRETLECPDLGFAFLAAFWAQGFALESARAVTVYARDVLRLTTLAAIAQPHNARSIHLLETLGFAAVGRTCLLPEQTDLMLFMCALGGVSAVVR